MKRSVDYDKSEQLCISRNVPIRKRRSHRSVTSKSCSSFSSSSSSCKPSAATKRHSQMTQSSVIHSESEAKEQIKRSKLNGGRLKIDRVHIALHWGPPYNIPSVEAEEALLPLLLQYGEKERGMMYKQHYPRIKAIQNACKQHKIHLDQALSMRRTHMMLLNPNIPDISRLGLGQLQDIRQSADLFEEAVASYLRRNGIRFYTENEQKSMARRKGQRLPPTPDFLLQESIILKSSSSSSSPQRIHWIEAKMFYAASTIPDGSKNAVGCLLQTARRYVETHGPGAFVFSFGYGARIKSVLEAEGVFVLDSKPLNLKQMREHQRSWCANNRGQILP
jgi:hypothetical protein